MTFNKDGTPRKKRDEKKNLEQRQRDMKARMELARRKDTEDWKATAAKVQAFFLHQHYDKAAAKTEVELIGLINDPNLKTEKVNENAA